MNTQYTPFWPDCCNHGDNCYIASFTIQTSPIHEADNIDIYLYHDLIGTGVCLRYGPEHSQYYSPGNVTDLAFSATKNPIYAAALVIINLETTMTWKKKQLDM